MNFQELLSRMREFDQPMIEEPNEGNAYGQAVQNTPPGEEIKINGKGTGDIKREDSLANECGPDMGSSSSQPDNVSMNVNMSGSGSGGIKDLLDILRNLESGEDDLGKMIGAMDHPHKEPLVGAELGIDEYANSPEGTAMAQPVKAPMNTMIASGDDLHRSHGSYSDRPYRGDNPMATESIRTRLNNLYNKMKTN